MISNSFIEMYHIDLEANNLDDASLIDEILEIMKMYQVEDDIHKIVENWFLYNKDISKEDRIKLKNCYIISYVQSTIEVD